MHGKAMKGNDRFDTTQKMKANETKWVTWKGTKGKFKKYERKRKKMKK